MTLKEQVLRILEKSKGSYVSGSELAEKLYVSRNAVWKAVKTLERNGHRIRAVTNKGYCLDPESDVLSTAGIEKYLSDSKAPFHIRVFKTLDSTNSYLKERASKGEPEGAVIAADAQTGGRGRLGRQFYSPAGTGIYFSLLLRPRVKAEEATMITAAAAVAVAQAIEEEAGVEASIKWVNDVFCRGKKVCGILTEGAFDFESGGMDYVVLGIGVNILPPEQDFPDAVAGVAGAVFEKAKSAPEIRSRLIAEILKRFWPFYEDLPGKTFLEEYQARSFIVGHDVDVITGDCVKRAYALEIDDNCRLIVRYEDGKTEALSSGEVSIRPAGL